MKPSHNQIPRSPHQLVDGGGCTEAYILTMIDENIRIRVMKLGEIRRKLG